MNIPETVKIGPHIYSVRFNSVLTRDRQATGQSCLQGTWIEIDPTCPKSVQEETLIHEVLEQISVDNDMELDHQIISTLAIFLYQFIAENPKAFKQEDPHDSAHHPLPMRYYPRGNN